MSARALLAALRNGLREGYPLCCVLHYAVVAGWTRDESLQAVHRGGVSLKDGREYVTCAWHSGRHAGWEPYPYGPERFEAARKQLAWMERKMERVEQEVFPDARPRSEVVVEPGEVRPDA